MVSLQLSSWIAILHFEGKEKRISLGVYPDISLKDARNRRDDCRKMVANDIDPSEHRKAKKAARVEQAANSFEVVAREWFVKYSSQWSENRGSKILRRLERDVLPWIGNDSVADINAPKLLTVIQRIESRDAIETAHHALSNCGQVFRYAIATGRAYNRTAYLPERKKMMQAWADYLDELKNKALQSLFEVEL